MEGKLPILVVEDEPAIRAGLCDVLAYHGYSPLGVESGEEGLRGAAADDYALVILDIMLPGMSGLDVCRELRNRNPEQAILVLTARGSEEDVLEGFRCGADDYVTKPFSVSELVARVGALLRRSGRLDPAATLPFQFGPWSIDTAARLAANGRTTVPLSRRELDMLRLFARERGRIVSRRTLLKDVWGMRHVEHIHTRTVDMHIVKLRRKLGMTDGAPLETIRGEGYRFLG
ncbi:response regulator transcription factor [Candidatus Binatia bacterium]|nr:response regulator transcription factor [Candidatus Binatia bacterium]